MLRTGKVDFHPVGRNGDGCHRRVGIPAEIECSDLIEQPVIKFVGLFVVIFRIKRCEVFLIPVYCRFPVTCRNMAVGVVSPGSEIILAVYASPELSDQPAPGESGSWLGWI